MVCRSTYDEMMSLKLDGLLGSDESRLLMAHVESCADCAELWAAMSEADELLCASSREPVPLSVDFQAKVMHKIALLPVYRPQLGAAVWPAAVSSVPTGPATQVLPPEGWLIAGLDTLLECRHSLSRYLRGAAAIGLSIAGTAGLMIALLMSGALTVGGPFEGSVATMRTFFAAVGTWLNSLLLGVGAGVVSAGGLVAAIMLVVAWQVVSAYQRAVDFEQAGAGLTEALG